MKNSSSRRGFSILELLVVIAIMAVLTSIVYLSVNETRSKSRDQQRISAVLKIKLGLEYYYNLHKGYPMDLTSLTLLPNTSPGKLSADDLIPPNNDQTRGYFYVPLLERGSTSVCNSYHLYTELESNTSVMSSKASFNSVGEPTCGADPALAALEIDASSAPLIYDVRPQQ